MGFLYMHFRIRRAKVKIIERFLFKQVALKNQCFDHEMYKAKLFYVVKRVRIIV